MANQKLFRVRGVPLAYPTKVKAFRGGEVDLTEERLRGIADRYDPAKHEARVVIGHTDDTTAPSYGFIESVRFEDGYLKADYAGMSESAVRCIQRTGSHPRRSMELIQLDGDYLGDTAQLGANRPAIKGLPNIIPSQIEAMSEAECLAFAEKLGDTDESTGFLFSEEAESPEEKPDMASDNEIKLAEEKAQAEAKLAEETRKREDLETRLAEADRRDAARLAELKFSEAQAESLKFAESESIRPRLGGNDADTVAKVIAHARLNCPDIDGVNFGEALEQVFTKLPDGPPLGKGKALEGKPEGNDKGELKFSERVQSGLDAIKEQHGEDSKQYKAAYAAAEKVTLQFAEETN